ncbi:hypothetical protein PAST2_07727 [Cutibacterium acnes HL202PA1]|nr:hypothetical protein TIIST44_05775 [Cutibacterium acnes subsp. defendens ATCC 11828]KFC14305.1 hypothetical protein PAST2_07727 [Cutibacterium acnes HL202PA1]MCM4180120.1 hypothetical protein [Cutibacterium acnes P15]MCU7483615.1 hypothetical protein [Cutibacterium acnes 19B2]MCU7486658.1 hypothetical protein [Cutibacterium acnes 19B1]
MPASRQVWIDGAASRRGTSRIGPAEAGLMVP